MCEPVSGLLNSDGSMAGSDAHFSRDESTVCPNCGTVYDGAPPPVCKHVDRTEAPDEQRHCGHRFEEANREEN